MLSFVGGFSVFFVKNWDFWENNRFSHWFEPEGGVGWGGEGGRPFPPKTNTFSLISNEKPSGFNQFHRKIVVFCCFFREIGFPRNPPESPGIPRNPFSWNPQINPKIIENVGNVRKTLKHDKKIQNRHEITIYANSCSKTPKTFENTWKRNSMLENQKTM